MSVYFLLPMQAAALHKMWQSYSGSWSGMHLWGPQEREDERDAPEAVEEKLSERSHDLPQPQNVEPRIQPLRCFRSCVEQPAIDLVGLK